MEDSVIQLSNPKDCYAACTVEHLSFPVMMYVKLDVQSVRLSKRVKNLNTCTSGILRLFDIILISTVLEWPDNL